MADKIKKIIMTIGIILLTCNVSYGSEARIYADDQVVVEFTSKASAEAIDQLISNYELGVIEHMPQINTYVFSLPEDGCVEEMVDMLNGRGIVMECEPNYTSSTHDLPDDDLVSQQWNISSESGNAHLHMEEAWALESGNSDVVVAVIEIGFDMTHEDLKDNIWQNPNEIPNNNIDDDGNGYVDDIVGWDFVHRPSESSISDIVDEDNDPTAAELTHGNRVLGVLGATMNNGVGIAGIAGNCKMMLIRAGYLSDDGRSVLSVSFIAKGIIYAVDNGAQVINISAGGSNYSTSLETAVTYAVERGVVVVCSAGNDGTVTPHYPAAYDIPGVISVGSSTENDQKCWFSNYGDWVDVSAPGQQILTTFFDNEYGATQGTSFSAPMVSGVAALLVSRYPDWTPAQIQDRLMNTADMCDGLNNANITSGRVNAFKALYDPEIDSVLDNDTTTTTGGEANTVSNASSSSGGGCFISSI